jgi:hypothetical protein
MLKLVLLVVLACNSDAYSLEHMSAANMTGFLTGLATGLAKSPSSVCSQSIMSFISATSKVLTDMETPVTTLQTEINSLNDLQTLVNTVGPVMKCDFSSLNGQVKKIFSKGGFDMLINNYLNNGAAIYQDVHTMEKCATNWNACGQAYGNAFKNIVGWGLN